MDTIDVPPFVAVQSLKPFSKPFVKRVLLVGVGVGVGVGVEVGVGVGEGVGVGVAVGIGVGVGVGVVDEVLIWTLSM